MLADTHLWEGVHAQERPTISHESTAFDGKERLIPAPLMGVDRRGGARRAKRGGTGRQRQQRQRRRGRPEAQPGRHGQRPLPRPAEFDHLCPSPAVSLGNKNASHHNAAWGIFKRVSFLLPLIPLCSLLLPSSPRPGNDAGKVRRNERRGGCGATRPTPSSSLHLAAAAAQPPLPPPPPPDASRSQPATHTQASPCSPASPVPTLRAEGPSTAQHSTAQHSTAQHSSAQLSSAQLAQRVR